MLAYTRMLYMPKAIDKMGKAMETAIEKKVQKPVKESEKKEELRAKAASESSMKITKDDLKILQEAIRAAKAKVKPLESAQDYLGDKVKKLSVEVEEDKEEGINNSVLKKIGNY